MTSRTALRTLVGVAAVVGGVTVAIAADWKQGPSTRPAGSLGTGQARNETTIRAAVNVASERGVIAGIVARILM